jgi:hypothetical protein
MVQITSVKDFMVGARELIFAEELLHRKLTGKFFNRHNSLGGYIFDTNFEEEGQGILTEGEGLVRLASSYYLVRISSFVY